MQQNALTTSPMINIMASLEAPTPSECRVWLRMSVTERQMMLRAANCPEHCSMLSWQAMQATHRTALRRAAALLSPNIGGIAHA